MSSRLRFYLKLAVLALWVMISYGMLKILGSNSLWVIKNYERPFYF